MIQRWNSFVLCLSRSLLARLSEIKEMIKILSANVILPPLSLNSKASTDCLRLLFFTDHKNALASKTHCQFYSYRKKLGK